MKKLLFFTCIIIFIGGCKKAADPKTTYQIINNVHEASPVEYFDGSLWEVVVYSYTGTTIVRQDSFDQITPDGGKSPITEVPSNYDKIKVSFKYIPAKSIYAGLPENVRIYVVALTPIEKGKNNIVTIEGTTMVSNQMINTSRQFKASSYLFSFKSLYH